MIGSAMGRRNTKEWKMKGNERKQCEQKKREEMTNYRFVSKLQSSCFGAGIFGSLESSRRPKYGVEKN
jgi:hypothetical protein